MAGAVTLEARASEFVERATDAFRRRLAELVGSGGLPEETPETLGERAVLASAAATVWTEHAGPFVDTRGVMSLLGGVTKQAVSQRVKGGRLLALRTGSGRTVYPLWQFQGGDVLDGLPEVLGTAGFDPDRTTTGWTLASWLVTEDPDLGGSPRELLEAGRVEPVLRAARGVRAELGTDELAATRSEAAA